MDEETKRLVQDLTEATNHKIDAISTRLDNSIQANNQRLDSIKDQMLEQYDKLNARLLAFILGVPALTILAGKVIGGGSV